MIYKTKLPAEGQTEIFESIIINYEQKKVISEFEQQYKAVRKSGFVGGVQGSANNRFLYIQLVLPHKVKPGNLFLINNITPESSNIVFVGFNTLTNQLKKLKITLEVPKLNQGIDFIVI